MPAEKQKEETHIRESFLTRLHTAMDLTERIVTDLPIYHLGCTMEESADRVLEQAIYGAE